MTLGDGRRERRGPPERLDFRLLFRVKGATGADQENLRIIRQYFRQFIRPAGHVDPDTGRYQITSQHCWGCGKLLVGTLVENLIEATFRWGLAHGKGYCRVCGWPSVGHHYVRNGDEDLIVLRDFILQVHPEHVVRREDVGAEES